MNMNLCLHSRYLDMPYASKYLIKTNQNLNSNLIQPTNPSTPERDAQRRNKKLRTKLDLGPHQDR